MSVRVAIMLVIFCAASHGYSGKRINAEGTENEKRKLRDGDFFVGAEDVAEGGADFA